MEYKSRKELTTLRTVPEISKTTSRPEVLEHGVVSANVLLHESLLRKALLEALETAQADPLAIPEREARLLQLNWVPVYVRTGIWVGPGLVRVRSNGARIHLERLFNSSRGSGTSRGPRLRRSGLTRDWRLNDLPRRGLTGSDPLASFPCAFPRRTSHIVTENKD